MAGSASPQQLCSPSLQSSRVTAVTSGPDHCRGHAVPCRGQLAAGMALRSHSGSAQLSRWRQRLPPNPRLVSGSSKLQQCFCRECTDITAMPPRLCTLSITQNQPDFMFCRLRDGDAWLSDDHASPLRLGRPITTRGHRAGSACMQRARVQSRQGRLRPCPPFPTSRQCMVPRMKGSGIAPALRHTQT